MCLNGALAKAEPTTLRYQLLQVAARIAQRHRDLYLRIDATWQWRDALDAASGRLAPSSAESRIRTWRRPR